MIRSKTSDDNDTDATDITASNSQRGGANVPSKRVMRFGTVLFMALVAAAAMRLVSPPESLHPKEVVLEKGLHDIDSKKISWSSMNTTADTDTDTSNFNPKEPGAKDDIAQRLADARLKRLEKRKHGQRKERDPYIRFESKQKDSGPSSSSSKALKVPYPIFVLNLPKTGTTTLWQYFECGLGPNKAIHWWTTDYGKQIGPCVEFNIAHKKAPLKNCGKYDVWLDFGYATPKNCFFPAVQGLEALYKSYPHATFLWIRRDTEAWFQSAVKWGPMLDKWSVACREDFFPHLPADVRVQKEDFKPFYESTTARIRQFAKDHPDMNYLEPPENITLSSSELGTWLEDNIGIEASCWGKCQPTGKTAKCESDQDGR